MQFPKTLLDDNGIENITIARMQPEVGVFTAVQIIADPSLGEAACGCQCYSICCRDLGVIVKSATGQTSFVFLPSVPPRITWRVDADVARSMIQRMRAVFVGGLFQQIKNLVLLPWFGHCGVICSIEVNADTSITSQPFGLSKKWSVGALFDSTPQNTMIAQAFQP